MNVAMLDLPLTGMEVRLRCRRPDGQCVTVKALTYRQAVLQVPPGWAILGAAIAETRAADTWGRDEANG